MILIELDKAGAEWVIVAHLSGDENMLDVVRSGKSPHTRTGALISGAPEDLVEQENKVVGQHTDPLLIEELRQTLPEVHQPGIWLPRSMSIRQAGKKSNHALNYDMRYKRFALENELPENESRELVELYHKAYPGIRHNYHKSVQNQLRRDRTLINCFGRKRRFLGAWGPELFDAAYSFLPQSTVWDIIRQGLIRTYNDDSTLFKAVEILLEVHDSFDFQFPIRPSTPAELAEIIPKIALDYLNPTCVYNSLEFKIGTTIKIGFRYGDMHELTLSNNMEPEITKIIEELGDGKAA